MLSCWRTSLRSDGRIAPNLDYELDRFAEREGTRVTFNKEARDRFFASSMTRMATFSPKGRINLDGVEAEIARLKRAWAQGEATNDDLAAVLSAEQRDALDPFDRVHLAHVLDTCRKSRSLSEAGRTLFAASRARRASSNDADRLRKYLARFDLSWADL